MLLDLEKLRAEAIADKIDASVVKFLVANGLEPTDERALEMVRELLDSATGIALNHGWIKRAKWVEKEISKQERGY